MEYRPWLIMALNRTAKEADSIGIAKDNAYNFQATKQGVEDMYCMVSNVVSESRKNRNK